MSELQNKFEVHCDKCGAEIKIAKTADTRIIARDRCGFPVMEQYFECQNCGRHYTVHITDRQMKLLIHRRYEVHRQIMLCRTIGKTEETIRKLIERNDELKQQQKELEAELKEKYKKECESDECKRNDFNDSDSCGSGSD